MKIIHLFIFGFGKWKDYSLDLTDPPPHLIIGENEAGKSTLYEFILFMLFGLPPKQRLSFVPKTGGSMGGRLVLSTEQYGRVTIERKHEHENGKAICRLETGEEKDESWLRNLLDGMERRVFESTYSFNAEDLMELKNLSGHELGEALLNIGLTGSDQIYQTEKWLQKQMDERFKPNGKKPLINEQLRVVEELQQKKKILDEEEENYIRLQQTKDTLNERIRTLGENWQETINQIYITEQVLKVRSIIVDYHLIKDEVEKQNRISFPEAGVERYQQVKEVLLPLQSEQKLLETNIEELEASIQHLEDGGDPSREEEGEKLLETGYPKYEQAVSELERLLQQISRIDEQVEEDKSHIDVPLDIDDLEEYPLPFYIEETWRALKKEKDEVEREEAYIQEQSADINREFEKIEERKHLIENERIGEETAKEYEEKLQRSYQTAAASDQDITDLRNRRLLGGVLAVFSLGIGGFLEGMVLFIVCLAIAALLALYSYSYHKKIVETSRQNMKTSIPVEEMEQARAQLQKYDAQKNEYHHLREQWKQLNQEEIRLQEKTHHLQQRKRRLESTLDEQRNLYPFLAYLDVEHWEKLYHLLSQLKEKKRTQKRLLQDKEKQSSVINHIKKNLEAFCRREKWEFYEENMEHQWNRLKEWVQEKRHNRQKIIQAEEQLEALYKRVKNINVKLSTYVDQQQELFKEVRVEKEEDFYTRAKQREKQEEQEKQLQDLERQLQRMLSEREQQDYLVWTEVPEKAALSARLERLQSEKQKIEAEQKKTQQAMADNQSAIQQLEHSDERSNITHKLHKEKAELQKQSEEWAAYQLAWKALEKTKHAYKEKYLPLILRKATNYFHRLTDGNYVDVKISPDDDRIKVISKRGFTYFPMELSRGTKDQLYVSFRLALGETMADDLSLPFLVDDAFVHFDQKRLNLMIQLFEQLSKKHQVVLFTWREDLEEAFHSPQVLRLS
ncbi:AAA family ATPase [Halobacillus sp. GSS1]|uniref:ATP-binding protein n=1 Tax=Halobacillus sp. GSS1 TaxID=2815919 RepID=UPI001A8DD9B0|nr:AAA family ATPase [Halobacillus sp. GSS1]MBN9655861.1 AAA family ATPase [Halobacillus sp. GSS1]